LHPRSIRTSTVNPKTTTKWRNVPGTSGTFQEHSKNILGTFQEHSGNVPGTFRTFQERSENVPGTFRERSENRERSKNVPRTLLTYSRNVPRRHTHRSLLWEVRWSLVGSDRFRVRKSDTVHHQFIPLPRHYSSVRVFVNRYHHYVTMSTHCVHTLYSSVRVFVPPSSHFVLFLPFFFVSFCFYLYHCTVVLGTVPNT